MSDQWPPPAPDASKAHKKAHDGEETNTLKASEDKIVTKKEIDDLEKKRQKPAVHLILTPRGMTTGNQLDAAKQERLKRMKQRLLENEGKARGDFDRSAGREM